MEKCLCSKMLGISEDRLVIHLMGCPEDWHSKEYAQLPWYKKLLQGNPASIYQEHKRQTGVYY